MIELLLIAVSLLLFAFFSAAETSLTSLSELKVQHLLEEYPERASGLRYWQRQSDGMLNTVLLCSNIAGIYASVVAADFAESVFGSSMLVVATVTGVMTVLSLMIGEITPKTYAKNFPVPLVYTASKLIYICFRLLYPVVWLMNIASVVVRMVVAGKESPKITGSELSFLIDASSDEGVIRDEQKQMLQSIYTMNQLTARQVMVPRTEIVAVSSDISWDAMQEIVRSSEYSRLPVYEGTIDTIVGVLNTKELLKGYEDGHDVSLVLKRMREAVFVPETKRAGELLRLMQSRRLHMVIVADEYGGVAGLVTLEDLLEEIVGEIWDEYDESTELMREIGEGRYLVDGSLRTSALCGHFDMAVCMLPFPKRTVSAMMLELAGKVPEKGEVYTSGGLEFTIVSVNNRRVELVEVFKR